MHRLLKRQIKRHFGKDFDISSLDDNMKKFLNNISETYEEQDKEKDFLEHTLDKNSEELNSLNKLMKDENKNISAQLLQYKEAIETVLYVCVTDLNGNIEFANNNFIKSSGYSFDELRRCSFNDLQSEESYLFSSVVESFADKGFWQGTLKIKTLSNEIRHLNGAIFLVDKKQYMFISNDITILEEARIKAELGEKAKDEFLANMSHEIRTPLNAIIGFANILKDSNMPEREKNQALIISKSSNLLLNIINSILDISKIQSGRFEIHNETGSLKELLNHVHSMFCARASEKNITLESKIDSNIPEYLIFDNTRLQQIISNLLSNAIKFTPDKGTVLLNSRLISKDNNKAKIYIEVKDNGIGIPNDKKELIFEPFSQGDSSVTKKYGGTGLGLSIVSNILELIGSKIYLESSKEKGSCFYFELNLDIDSSFVEINQEKESIENLPKNGNILVAEDNPINIELMKALLEILNLSADYVKDGFEAIKLFKEKEYRLVFMDINMPNCDGISATSEIRKYEKKSGLQATPIIALTANIMEGDREKFLSNGMNEHIGKPINFEIFKEVINKYL